MNLTVRGIFLLLLLCSLATPSSLLADTHGGTTGTQTQGGTVGDPTTGGTTGTPTYGGTVGQGQTLMNPLKADSLEDLLQLLLDAVVQIGTIILVLAIIWVGFLFVKARGNPAEITKAKQALLWTVIGGLILLGAEAIGLVIKETANTL